MIIPLNYFVGMKTVISFAFVFLAAFQLSVFCREFCTSKWTKINGRCYRYLAEKMDWETARDECNKTGGYLVQILEQTESDAIKQNLGVGQDTWLGGKYIRTKREWLWTDGSKVDGTDQWYPNEPDTPPEEGEDCLNWSKNYPYKFADVQCYNRHKFLCEKANISCKAGETRPHTTYKNNCYVFWDEWTKWETAVTRCGESGGFLANMNDDHENKKIYNWINSTTKAYDVFLGGNDKLAEGEWVWSDGNKMNYTEWAPNQPNNWKPELCISMQTDLRWRDKWCGFKIGVLCERDPEKAGEATQGEIPNKVPVTTTEAGNQEPQRAIKEENSMRGRHFCYMIKTKEGNIMKCY